MENQGLNDCQFSELKHKKKNKTLQNSKSIQFLIILKSGTLYGFCSFSFSIPTVLNNSVPFFFNDIIKGNGVMIHFAFFALSVMSINEDLLFSTIDSLT